VDADSHTFSGCRRIAGVGAKLMTAYVRCRRLLALAAIALALATGCAADTGARDTVAPAAIEGPPAAQATSVPSPSATPPPVTGLAATLPIIDLHLHLNSGWDPPALVQLFDELGVARAGGGAPPDSAAVLRFTTTYPTRFVPFAGEGELRRLLSEGERAWNLESPAVLDYLMLLEASLQAGSFKGIGELYPNNRVGGGVSRYPADSPLMQRLWALSATYQVPLSVHMDATDDSVAEMERLLASDRRGIWIWAHTGLFAEPSLVRRLLQSHPNLTCELSGRLPTGGIGGPPPGVVGIVDAVNYRAYDGRLRPAWKELLEEFPDRFVIGTDPVQPRLTTYALVIGVWRQILGQLTPETAKMLAHGNAERLLGPVP
jgi:hypothetical protein